jgi:hypothetical protein
LHEGGFTIHRDERGGIYFRRPDGRVIPRSGYRAEDMLDDLAAASPGANPCAEVRMAAIVHGFAPSEDSSPEPWSYRGARSENPSAEGFGTRVVAENPSAEVREARGSYRVGFSQRVDPIVALRADQARILS